MKRGWILLLIIILLITVNAQDYRDDLRVSVDTKRLGEDGIIVNLTEFLGNHLEYFLLSKPDYVKVIIQNDFGLAKITKLKGAERGVDILIFTTNKSRLLQNETIIYKKPKEETFNLIDDTFNSTLDNVLDKALLDYLTNLNLENYTIRNTNVNLSEGLLFVKIDNVSKIDLKLNKTAKNVILKNIIFNFNEQNNDENYLFYKLKTGFFYFIEENILSLLIWLFSIILLILVIILINRNKTKVVNKVDFKKVYLNKLNLLRRRTSSETDYEEIFEQFSDDIRTFLSKMLNIRYKFTYDELVNELIIKKVNEDLKHDIIIFVKKMNPDSYKKQPSITEIRALISMGIHIIERF